VPAWLQGMKQEGIRPAWQPALADPAVRSVLASLPSGNALLSSAPAEAKSAQEIGQHGLAKDAQTTQERVERWLVDELNRRFALWRVRSQAQGEIKLALLGGKEQMLRLRNAVLGTRAQNWVNVIPPVRYASSCRSASASTPSRPSAIRGAQIIGAEAEHDDRAGRER